MTCLQRPESEVIKCVNKFSADFGGQLVQLEHLQASLDHVSHRLVSYFIERTKLFSTLSLKRIE